MSSNWDKNKWQRNERYWMTVSYSRNTPQLLSKSYRSITSPEDILYLLTLKTENSSKKLLHFLDIEDTISLICLQVISQR